MNNSAGASGRVDERAGAEHVQQGGEGGGGRRVHRRGRQRTQETFIRKEAQHRSRI